MWKSHLKAISTLIRTVVEQLLLRTCTVWGLSCSPVPWTEELQEVEVHEMWSDISQFPFLCKESTAPDSHARHWSRTTREHQDIRFKIPLLTQPKQQDGHRLEKCFQAWTLWLIWEAAAAESKMKHPKAASCCLAACQPQAGQGPWCVVCGWQLPFCSRNHGTESIALFQTPVIAKLIIWAIINRKPKSVSQWWYHYRFQVPQAAPRWRLLILESRDNKGNTF